MHLSSTSLCRGWLAESCAYSVKSAVSASALALEGVPWLLFLGHIDGSVSKVSLSVGGSCCASTRHHAPVTALLALSPASIICKGAGSQAFTCSRFVSAAADGEVWLWDAHVLLPIHMFYEHCGAVHSLLQAPLGILSIQLWFIAVSNDGSISMHAAGDVGDNSVRLGARLSGHIAHVRDLLWRPAERMLCVRCSTQRESAPDAVLYVWALPAGRLESVLSGLDARLKLTGPGWSPRTKQPVTLPATVHPFPPLRPSPHLPPRFFLCLTRLLKPWPAWVSSGCKAPQTNVRWNLLRLHLEQLPRRCM